MRLWHKDLIHYLPRKQLLGQWRECCLIAKNIKEKGTPNHILVNKIMDYSINHFFTYCMFVKSECIERGYKIDCEKINKYFDEHYITVSFDDLFHDWHNKRYLIQCYHNLEEKYDCNGISAREFASIILLCNNYDKINIQKRFKNDYKINTRGEIN